MKRDYYSESIAKFRSTSPNEILGLLARSSRFSIEQTQRDAWLEEIRILKEALSNIEGRYILNMRFLEWASESMLCCSLVR